MVKRTIIEREYNGGELVKETETTEEWEELKYNVPTPFLKSPTISSWWKQPWTLTDTICTTGTWEQGTDGTWRKVR